MRGTEGAAAAGRDDTVYWCLRRRGAGVMPSLLLQPPRRSHAVLRGDESPLRGFADYSYSLVPVGGGTPVRSSPLA